MSASGTQVTLRGECSSYLNSASEWGRTLGQGQSGVYTSRHGSMQKVDSVGLAVFCYGSDVVGETIR